MYSNKYDQKIVNIKNKMEAIFEEMGFNKVLVGNSIFYLYDGCYHRIDYIGGTVQALVIETATSQDEIIKNLLEDDDVYPLSMGEDKILATFRDDLKKHYMD